MEWKRKSKKRNVNIAKFKSSMVKIWIFTSRVISLEDIKWIKNYSMPVYIDRAKER